MQASEEANARVRIVVFSQNVRRFGIDVFVKRRTCFRSLDDLSKGGSRLTRFRSIGPSMGEKLITYFFVEVPIPYLAKVA